MGDNFYKENKMNNLGMVGLEQTSVSSRGQKVILSPAAVLFGTLLIYVTPVPQSPYR